MDGHRGGDRLHDRPPGQRRHARHAPRARRHGDRRLRRPRLDPRRLPALAGEAAPVPPRPARQAREDARARGDDGGGVLVVVDGVFSMEGDVADLPRIVELVQGARRAADGRRGPRRRRARRARRRAPASCSASRTDVDLRMGTFSKSLASCGGFIAGPHEVIDFLRISARARSCSPPPAVPAAVGAALAALRIIRSDEGPELFARVLDNARYLNDGLHDARLPACVEPQPTARRPTTSRRSCPWSSATTGRPCCSGARSTTPASTSTSRCTRPSRRPARCCARA